MSDKIKECPYGACPCEDCMECFPDQPSVVDLIKAGMGGDGRYRATSSEGSEHVDSAEVEIHVDLTGKLVLSIEHGSTCQHWALEQGHE